MFYIKTKTNYITYGLYLYIKFDWWQKMIIILFDFVCVCYFILALFFHLIFIYGKDIHIYLLSNFKSNLTYWLTHANNYYYFFLVSFYFFFFKLCFVLSNSFINISIKLNKYIVLLIFENNIIHSILVVLELYRKKWT